MIEGLNVMTIDPSLRGTGICINGKYCTTLKIKSTVPESGAVFLIADGIKKILQQYRIDIVFMEDYSYGDIGRATSITSMAEVRGALKYILLSAGIPVYAMAIPMWKSITRFKMKKTGKGAMARYIQEAQKLANRPFDTADEVDAFCIYAALRMIMNAGPKTDAQKTIYSNFMHERRKLL